MTLVLAGLVLAALALPHLVRLDQASPAVGATIWLSALVLRALTALFAAIFVVLYLPTTALFTLVTHWCWHAVLPLFAAHLPLNGHALGDAAIIAPAVALALTALSAGVGLWRATRRVRQAVEQRLVGPGPRESLVVADGSILIAAAGLRRPQVIVSAGALLTLDDDELAASLEHEHGHIARRHRYVLVAAAFCRALGRWIPATDAAYRELLFWLERDADRYAVTRQHHPAALASAICKSAGAWAPGPPALALGGGPASRRVQVLLAEPQQSSPRRAPLLRAIAISLAVLAVSGIAALPAAAHAGIDQVASVPAAHQCDS
jgi:Zn-dependent protease with chaperone function